MLSSSKMLVGFCHNPLRLAPGGYPETHREVLSLEKYRRAARAITQWEGYRPTPLHRLSRLEETLGIGSVLYKDESERFGLGSFKALGGAYAVMNLLKRLIQSEGLAESVADSDLIGGNYADFANKVTVTSATDGNHGRSVAWGAQRFGCRCVIYIHAEVSEERKTAIEALGATVVRVEGNYDFSVAEAERNASLNGWHVVSDTTYPGYTDIPRDVMQGYTVMVQEALDQAGEGVPTHIFIQAGVGGLPAAVVAHCWELYGADAPRFVVVEPENAACVYRSIQAGKPVAVHGDLDTVMAGLACGEVSISAFAILKDSVESCMVITDESVKEVMRLCANGAFGPPIVSGESAGAGLAALILACNHPELKTALGLGAQSKILLFGTEGATAPSIYRRITGKSAIEVLAG